MNIRPYDPHRDRGQLWTLKQAFERELGAAGSDAKGSVYDDKLTDAYRNRYLDWVERCVAESADCLQVGAGSDGLAGYTFLLPESLAMIWDAAVLNELYVVPDHRGSGLADRLLEGTLAVADDQSLPMNRLLLDVAPTNERALALYERHGFEPWGRVLARNL